MTPKKEYVEVQGKCHPDFNAVRVELENNFSSQNEIGSAVCIYHKGEKVVDLWGGHQDAKRLTPWKEDTLCAVYSITKSISILSVHILADRGLVDLEAPVAKYWPGFAQNGKESIKVRHVLSHFCGICFNDTAEAGDIFDYDQMIKVIESQEPAWPPETKGAYNTVNIGYMAGEIVRRVSGLSIRDFVQKNICTPLNAEFKIGVDKEDLDRVADICPNSAGFSMKSAATPGTPLARAWKAMPSTMNAATHNTTDFRLGALPSFGGFGTARGIARIYAALANGGEIDGVQLATSKTIKKATEDQWHDESDGTTGQEIRMGIGFFKNTNHLFGPNADSFGHHGSGGTRALADPSENLSLGFVSNLMSEKLGTGIRTEAIVKAAYSNL